MKHREERDATALSQKYWELKDQGKTPTENKIVRRKTGEDEVQFETGVYTLQHREICNSKCKQRQVVEQT